MSGTTRLRGIDMPAWMVVGLLACAAWMASANAAPAALPAEVRAIVPDARLQGSGELRFLGLSIYDGHFWSAERGYSLARAFALDLHYHRDLTGAQIVQRSVDEIVQLGYGSTAERARWARLMKQFFPDVRRGDRLTGVNVPGQGARFYFNGDPIGEIAELAFAQAFFGIWLDPSTSRPDFRRQIMGEP